MILPDLESLRCFEAAATQLNFRQASAQVHLSPTAFSERIRQLEATLGSRLFERTTRRVSLTSAGLRLLPQAKRCLDEARRCASAVADQGPLAFELVLGTRFELGLSWLTPALAGLERARPERGIHLLFGDSADLLLRVQRGEIDAAISSARISSAGLQYRVLHEESYAFVGATTLLARRPLRTAAQAAEHVLLDAHPDLPLFRYFQDAAPPDEVWAFGRLQRLGTIAAIRMEVLEGRGVAVLPHYLIREDLRRRRLTAIRPRLGLQRDSFRLIWRQAHPLQRELVALADALRDLPIR